MIQALFLRPRVPTRTEAATVYFALLKAYNELAGLAVATACGSLMVGCGSNAAAHKP